MKKHKLNSKGEGGSRVQVPNLLFFYQHHYLNAFKELQIQKKINEDYFG